MKKKLLFFHFDLEGGGAEKVLVNLLDGLNPQKYDITLFVIFGTGCNMQNLAPHIHFKYAFKKHIRGITTLMKLFSPQMLYRFFIKGHYDVEVAYMEFSPTRILAGSSNHTAKRIAWVHSRLKSLPSAFRSVGEMRRCYETFDKIVFVAEQSKTAFLELIGRNNLPTITLPNIMDVVRIKNLATASLDIKLDHKVINFCYIGKLDEQKGCMRLAETVHALHQKKLTNWCLYYLGIGKQKEQLETFIHNSRLNDHIVLLGYQDNPYKYIRCMDFFVCPSYSEGYSTSTIEALILGIPVVCTDCGGMDEILDCGKYGLLVDNTDESLQQGIETFLTEPEQLLHYRKMASIRGQFFEPANALRMTENVIDNL